MTHYFDKCKHGVVVRQCRCHGPKTVNVVPCPPMCPSEPTYPCDQCGKAHPKPSEQKIQPAMDEELAVVRPLGYRCIGCVLGTPPETHGGACIFAMEPKLLARIASDREKIAAQDVELSNLRQAKFWAVEKEARLREKIAALETQNAQMRKALERLRDCDWTISLPDRMDAVRDIAREALK